MAVKGLARGKRCCIDMLHAIREANPLLDLHGGLACAAPVHVYILEYVVAHRDRTVRVNE